MGAPGQVDSMSYMQDVMNLSVDIDHEEVRLPSRIWEGPCMCKGVCAYACTWTRGRALR